MDERDAELPWRERRSRSFKMGDRVRYRSFAAYCTDDCAACRDGESLPDW